VTRPIASICCSPPESWEPRVRFRRRGSGTARRRVGSPTDGRSVLKTVSFDAAEGGPTERTYRAKYGDLGEGRRSVPAEFIEHQANPSKGVRLARTPRGRTSIVVRSPASAPRSRSHSLSVHAATHDQRTQLGAEAVGTPERVYELFPRLADRKRNGGSPALWRRQQMLAIGRALLLNRGC